MPAERIQNKSGKLWVTVKVERGFISEAKVFQLLSAAKRTERSWRSRINPDYDEVAVLGSRLEAHQSKPSRRAGIKQWR
jgi:hypothetical protein